MRIGDDVGGELKRTTKKKVSSLCSYNDNSGWMLWGGASNSYRKEDIGTQTELIRAAIVQERPTRSNREPERYTSLVCVSRWKGRGLW